MEKKDKDKKIQIEEILKESFKTAKNAINTAKKAANVGTKKLSIYMLRNKLKEALSELGNIVYKNFIDEKQETINISNKNLKNALDAVEKVNLEIMALESKIKDIKEK